MWETDLQDATQLIIGDVVATGLAADPNGTMVTATVPSLAAGSHVLTTNALTVGLSG